MDCLRHRILALFVVGCITLTLSSVQTSARQTQPVPPLQRPLPGPSLTSTASPAITRNSTPRPRARQSGHCEPSGSCGGAGKSYREASRGLDAAAGHAPPRYATYRAVAVALERELDRTWEANPNPGRIGAVHRLNRAEYNNAIRDLLAVDLDVKPCCPGTKQRTAVSTTLRTPSRFRRLTSSVICPWLVRSRGWLQVCLCQSGARDIRNSPARDPGRPQERRSAARLSRGNRDSPRLPVNGEYLIKVRLQRHIRTHQGMGCPNSRRRLDGTLLKRFTVGGKRKAGPQRPVTRRRRARLCRRRRMGKLHADRRRPGLEFGPGGSRSARHCCVVRQGALGAGRPSQPLAKGQGHHERSGVHGLRERGQAANRGP